MDPLNPSNPPIRNLQLDAGNQGAFLNLSRGLANDVGSNVPDIANADLGNQIMQLLQTYQQYGQNTQNNAQREQVTRTQNTPQSLIGASPSLQEGARSASVQALQPTIAGAQNIVTGANNAITNAKNYLQSLESTKNAQRDDARSILKDIITNYGGDEILHYAVSHKDEIDALEKQAGYPKGFLAQSGQTIKDRELKLKEDKITSIEDQLYGGLSTPTATAVRARVAKFSTEPVITNFSTVQEGYNFAKSLSDTTQNPADDQALIYSLAKALDPGSVVREGEYATAQKYAQSWIQAYGKGITQALAGTGFLSEDARRNIKKTIEQKYQASKRSYDNLYNQYKTGINNLTGRGDGEQFLIDYITPTQDASREYTDEEFRSLAKKAASQGMSLEETLQQLNESKSVKNKDRGLQVLQDFRGAFPKAGSPTSSAGSTQKLAEAIGKVESSGNYQAVSPVNRNGERAYGKYQVLASNIPVWTKEVLGRALSVAEFLKDTVAQDKVALAKIGSLLNKHGNPADVASVWFSGRPLTGNQSKDITGVSVPQYVQKVLKNLG